MANKKTYLDYEYELRPYRVRITRVDKNGKYKEVWITEYWYTRVDEQN